MTPIMRPNNNKKRKIDAVLLIKQLQQNIKILPRKILSNIVSITINHKLRHYLIDLINIISSKNSQRHLMTMFRRLIPFICILFLEIFVKKEAFLKKDQHNVRKKCSGEFMRLSCKLMIMLTQLTRFNAQYERVAESTLSD